MPSVIMAKAVLSSVLAPFFCTKDRFKIAGLKKMDCQNCHLSFVPFVNIQIVLILPLRRNESLTMTEHLFSQPKRFFRTSGACIIKLFTAVICGFRNKLECVTLKARVGWKGLPGTNTLAYYRNCKLRL